jgi:Family of unknown function (DUF5682)
MSLHIFGIRHHGPGSSRSLQRALESLEPDCILIEGPPEADGVLSFVLSTQMRPPVAILVYNAETPSRAVYYPFAAFSPEWAAIKFGLARGLPVRFMDLPQAHQLLEEETLPEIELPELDLSSTPNPTEPPIQSDPLSWLARAAGFSDGERYWEYLVESRGDETDVFPAILEAMTALRTEASNAPDFVLEAREARREAHMRTTIRAAQKEGFAKIAVVCGAWHSPVLDVASKTIPDAKSDTATLKGLPKVKVSATWTPWTHGRLSRASGYGAGVDSPGWYAHLFEHSHSGSSLVTTYWMASIARLLRSEGLDASSASVIEAVRLSETISSLRGLPMPGLMDLSDAARAVFLSDSELPMTLIHDRLIVGETLGSVPPEVPTVPLQRDLEAVQKRLRLQPEASEKNLELDLRKSNELERSVLLHRLNLLGIAWGEIRNSSGTGTFKETWLLRWQPEFAVRIIEMGTYGQSVLEAATAYAKELSDKSRALPALTELLDLVLLAALPNATGHLLARLEAESALSSDVPVLMAAIPPLARVLRYSDVRQTDSSVVGHVVNGLITRVSVGLPGASLSLSNEAAEHLFKLVLEVNASISTMNIPEHLETWLGTLEVISSKSGIHGLLAGRAVRLLLEAERLDASHAAKALSFAASSASDPAQVGVWVEGFLTGSGLVLLHDDTLWGVLESWLMALSEDHFIAVLPLLRRTFSSFPAPERRSMGEKAKHGEARVVSTQELGIDETRAALVLPLIAKMLGLEVQT